MAEMKIHLIVIPSECTQVHHKIFLFKHSVPVWGNVSSFRLHLLNSSKEKTEFTLVSNPVKFFFVFLLLFSLALYCVDF